MTLRDARAALCCAGMGRWAMRCRGMCVGLSCQCLSYRRLSHRRHAAAWRLGLLSLLIVGATPAVSQAQCSMSVTGVAFGNYDVLNGTARDMDGSITVTCLLSLLPSVTLSTGSSGTFAARTMKKGAESLSYNLYLDAARTTVWGDGTGGTQKYQALAVLLGSTVLPVYGRIPPKQNVTAGMYTDTIIVTLTF